MIWVLARVYETTEVINALVNGLTINDLAGSAIDALETITSYDDCDQSTLSIVGEKLLDRIERRVILKDLLPEKLRYLVGVSENKSLAGLDKSFEPPKPGLQADTGSPKMKGRR